MGKKEFTETRRRFACRIRVRQIVMTDKNYATVKFIGAELQAIETLACQKLPNFQHQLSIHGAFRLNCGIFAVE